MITTICTILSLICVVSAVLLIYVVARLNKHIASLEEDIERYTDRVDNLQDAMQRGLKENLFKDGSLKKPLVSVDDMS